MAVSEKLNLKEVTYLIVNKPLIIVKLEHSSTSKQLIIKALNLIWKDRKGQVIFQTLHEFLRDVAPNYELNGNQEGARRFLLREIEKIMQQPKKRLTGFFRWGLS